MKESAPMDTAVVDPERKADAAARAGLDLRPRVGRAEAPVESAAPTAADRQTVGTVTVDNPVFSCRNVDVYYGDKHAIKNVTIDIGRGEVLAMIGPSGCGKSTFLRCLNRMNDTIPIARVTGTILLDGNDIHDEAPGCGAAACARRHGVSEAEPVSEIDLRERSLRPAYSRLGRRSRGTG